MPKPSNSTSVDCPLSTRPSSVSAAGARLASSSEHAHAHRRGVGERRRAGREHGVLDAVLARLVGREVAQQVAGREGERVGRRRDDRRRVERRTAAGGRDVVLEHRDVDLRTGAHDDGVVDGDRGELRRGRQQVDRRLALDARALVVGAVADRVRDGAEASRAAVGGGARDAEVVLTDRVHRERGPVVRSRDDVAQQQHAARRVRDGGEDVEGRILLRMHERDDRRRRELRRRVRRAAP